MEESESQLYPHLLRELAEDFRTYAKKGGQVFLSTNSPEFPDNVDLDEVFCIVKENGFSKVVRPSDSEHLRDLANREGVPLGRLWRQGLFEEIPE